MDIEFNFLMCTERSGSNFITKLLNAHPEICGPTPIHLIRAISQNRLNYGDLNNNRNWGTLIQDFVEYLDYSFGHWESSITKKELLENCSKRNIESIIKYIFTKEAKVHKKSSLFIKENRIYNYMPFILAAFPNSKFIYLVRDIRDFALSWKKSPNHPGAIMKSCEVWKKDQEEFLKLYGYLFDYDRILLLRYEDLLSNTENELKKICKFLNKKFSSKMLDFHKDKLTIKNANRILDWKNLSKPVLKNNSKKFIKELSDWEIKYLEYECFELLDYFGYKNMYEKQINLDSNINELIKDQEKIYLKQTLNNLKPEEQEIRKNRLKILRKILDRKMQ